MAVGAALGVAARPGAGEVSRSRGTARRGEPMAEDAWKAPSESGRVDGGYEPLGMWTQWVRWQQILLVGFIVVVQGVSIGVSLVPTSELLVSGLMLGAAATAIVNIVGLFIWGRWHYLAAANLVALGRPTPTTPAAHVYWWYVPLFLLWKPYQATRELLLYSKVDNDNAVFEAVDEDETSGAGLATSGVLGTLPVWWGAHIASNVLNNIAQRMSMRLDADAVVVLLSVEVAATVAAVVAIAMYLRIIAEVDRDQVELAAASS